MLKTVIFDMDGVIIDSEPMHAASAVEALKQFGADISTAYCYQFIGSTTAHMVETIIKDFNLTTTSEPILEAIKKENQKALDLEGYLIIPGVRELIKELYKHGIQLAVASSSTQKEIETVIKSLGLMKYFDKLVSGCDVPKPKPAPDVFLRAMKELGASPDTSLIIEDSMNGTIAAKKAGVACIGFANPNSGKQNLNNADVIIESFESIDYEFLVNEYKRAHNQPITIANTKRLVIRELSVHDIPDIYQIYQNPMVKEYIDDIDDYLEVEIEKHKAYIRNVYGFYGYGLWGVFSKTTKQLIGRCGLEHKMIDGQPEIELEYLLDKHHWGYGYALECTNAVLNYAKEVLEITRIVAVIDKQNIRSIKLAERIGFLVEKSVMYHDRDCYLYSICLNTKKK